MSKTTSMIYEIALKVILYNFAAILFRGNAFIDELYCNDESKLLSIPIPRDDL